MKLLQKVYSKALQHSEKDALKKDNNYRYRLGIYGFSAKDDYDRGHTDEDN